jgi:cytidylate kinase
MLLLFAGPSGSGKSSAAALLKDKLKAEVYSGKGYYRMAKSPAEAFRKFQAVLQEAIDGKRNAILILVGTANLEKFKAMGKFCLIRFTAPRAVLESRFAGRSAVVTPQISKMIADQEAMWQDVPCDLVIDTSLKPVEEVVREIEGVVG